MPKRKKNATKPKRMGLRQQVLLAALKCSGGDLDVPFTAEELLLAAWNRDPMAWGLRGHEREHPDSERIYVELDRANVKGGMVGLGLFSKVRQRTYRLTPTGLMAALEVDESGASVRGKAERRLADAVSSILSHPVLAAWIKDQDSPSSFRDAGHFWGVAPGTPPRVIRARINEVDHTLASAAKLLEQQGADGIAARHGRQLFESVDIERAQEFHVTLKSRFEKDLAVLGVDL